MRRSDADLSHDERIDKIVDFVIKNIPDDRLFAEVQRRGGNLTNITFGW
jgi:hypothetical protein